MNDQQHQQEISIEWINSQQNLIEAIKNIQEWLGKKVLIISKCKSVDAVIELLSNDKFNEVIDETFPSLLAIRFQFDKILDLSELIVSKMCMKDQLLITFETESHKILHWTNLQSSNINQLQLIYSDAMNDFIVDFFLDSFENQLNVIVNNSSQYILTSINNSENLNLLMRASATNNQEILKELLKMPFDINQKSDSEQNEHVGQTAADLALERQIFDLLCLLLEHNSTFPRHFNINADVMKHEGIKKLVNISELLHEAIDFSDNEEVERILDENPNFVYFYDTTNQSAAAKAINKKGFNIYELLLMKGRCIGPYEDVDDILGQLDRIPKKFCRETHKGLAKKSEGHMTTILSRCSVSHDDQFVSQRHQLIYELLKNINELSFTSADGLKMPIGNYLLRLIAAYGNFNIFFDFNRTSVQHTNPFGNGKTKGLTTLKGNIYIGAQELLDEQTENKVIESTVHEFCHLASLIIFNNRCDPYASDDEEKKNEIKAIIESYKDMEHEEDIVDGVFGYDEKEWPSELIVRPPQLMARYRKNPKKLSKVRKTYEKLFKYFEEFFTTKMIKTLEVLEKLAKSDSTMTFSQLTDPFKDRIIQNDVDFQGENVKLGEIVEKTLAEAVLSHLKPSEMLGMINKNKKEMKIGENFEALKINQETYIERVFIDFSFDTSWTNMTYEGTWKPKVLESKKSFDEIVYEASKSKILLLSDEAGAGKSTTFKHLSIKLKKSYPRMWISYVDLKQHLKVYDKYSKNQEIAKTDMNLVTEVLREILKIENYFDFAVFKHLFELNQVVLLLDGADEIAPKFKTFFINLVLKISKYSENQVWIATRPLHMTELKNKLRIQEGFKLLPWDENQRKMFIENILKTKNIKADHAKMAEEINENIKKELAYDVSNPFLLRMFTNYYLIDGKIDESNLFSLYEKVTDSKIKILNDEKGKIANKYRDNKAAEMTIWQVHQVFALQTILNSELDRLKDLPIMQKWENEKSKWSPEIISRYGFLYVDNWDTEDESCNFIHRTVAEFFVAKYFIANVYEFADKSLSDEAVENQLWMCLQITVFEGVLKFIQSYLETKANVKQINKKLLKHFKSDKIQSYLKSDDDFLVDILRFLQCFCRHREALLILIRPENDEESFFQLRFKQFDIGDLIDFFEESFTENWPYFTGYKKINENEKFQHLTQEELGKYSKKSDDKAVLKLLNFIPQMQIPKEHLEKFFKNHFYIISCFQKTYFQFDLFKKFQKYFKSQCSHTRQEIVEIINEIISQNIDEFGYSHIEFLDFFFSPERNFAIEHFVYNTFNTKRNGLVEGILSEDYLHVLKFCKEKLIKKEIQKILSENFCSAIFYIKRRRLNMKKVDFLNRTLREFFPENMDEREKKLLKKMLTKEIEITDDEIEKELNQNISKISIMNFLPIEIKRLEEKQNKNKEDEEDLKVLHKLEEILTKLLNLVI